jgi:hypothetical protein
VLNTADDEGATVSGGRNNFARGNFSAIVGGGGTALADSNFAIGYCSTILGGRRNYAFGEFSVVGGDGCVVGVGNASCAIGNTNSATLHGSFACGSNATANHTESFVWGSATGSGATESFDHYTVTFRSPNGARFYTADTGTSTGVRLFAGGGAWGSLSDSTQKENVREVDTRSVLDRLSTLKISEWNYKSQDDHIRHMGPTAQDFHAAFGLGDNNTTISTLDPDGVLFAAVQELARRDEELTRHTNEIDDLKIQVAKLQSQLQSLIADTQQSAH